MQAETKSSLKWISVTSTKIFRCIFLGPGMQTLKKQRKHGCGCFYCYVHQIARIYIHLVGILSLMLKPIESDSSWNLEVKIIENKNLVVHLQLFIFPKQWFQRVSSWFNRNICLQLRTKHPPSFTQSGEQGKCLVLK